MVGFEFASHQIEFSICHCYLRQDSPSSGVKSAKMFLLFQLIANLFLYRLVKFPCQNSIKKWSKNPNFQNDQKSLWHFEGPSLPTALKASISLASHCSRSSHICFRAFWQRRYLCHIVIFWRGHRWRDPIDNVLSYALWTARRHLWTAVIAWLVSTLRSFFGRLFCKIEANQYSAS